MIVGGGIVGVGIDAVEVADLRDRLARRPSMIERLFAPEERAVLAGRHDPVPGLAARFAAKEAVMKSLGVGLGAFGFHDAVVIGGAGQAPRLLVRGAAAQLAEEAGVTRWHLSLTHTPTMAQAIVVAESPRA